MFSWKDNKASILTLCIILPLLIIIGTTPLHEMGHWILSDIDPYIEPVEMNFFNTKLFTELENKPVQHIISSNFGSIVIREAYPGAFLDRPNSYDLYQEIICITLQLIIAITVTIKILDYVTTKTVVAKKLV